jgi:D-alanyl-lipoteichoic acid acyltransferase DltB (MBOAT superfamily)
LDYFEYLLYVSFFSQLLAGPIVRASTLLPQIAQTPTLTAQQGGRAVFRIAIGLVKKIAIADFLGAHIVDPVFSNPQMYSSAEALFAVYSYAFQIYVDFSAYSDIAIGSAGLLGFQIPENFNAPYRAADLREFWQRWHISLSTWLRDYLYISLGGSRRNTARTIVNLMVTMLLGGLWHGAALTFIIWGALHGFALAATRIAQRLRRAQSKPTWHGRAVRVFITFHVVCAAWIFFRAPDLESAMSVFAAIGSFTFSTANISWQSAAMLAAAFFTHYVPESWIEKARDLFDAAPAAVQAAILVGAIMAVQAVASTEVAPFIYFQF